MSNAPHLIEWLILLAGLGAAMLPPTSVVGNEGEDSREPLDAFLNRIVRQDGADADSQTAAQRR